MREGRARIAEVYCYGGWRFWWRSAWHRLFGHTCAKRDFAYGQGWVSKLCFDCHTGWTESDPALPAPEPPRGFLGG